SGPACPCSESARRIRPAAPAPRVPAGAEPAEQLSGLSGRGPGAPAAVRPSNPFRWIAAPDPHQRTAGFEEDEARRLLPGYGRAEHLLRQRPGDSAWRSGDWPGGGREEAGRTE